MHGISLGVDAHIVNLIPPVDITGGAAPDVFSMKKHAHATIIIQIGVSAAAPTSIILNGCDNFAGDNPVAIPFDCRKEETANGDTLDAKTTYAATGITAPSANNGIMYVLEIDAEKLPAGKEFILLAIANGVNSVIASAVAILTGARYAGEESATAIA